MNVGYFGINNYQSFMSMFAANENEVLESASSVAVVEQCLFLDFSTDENLERASRRLMADDIVTETISYKSVAQADYWVILGPFDNAQDAKSQFENLQARGVDSLVVNAGRFQNALSFGVFDGSSQANQELARLREFGIQAKVEKIEQASFDRWLKVPPQDVYAIELNWLVRLKNDFNMTKSQKKSCN